MNRNFLTEKELHEAKGLMHYLTENLTHIQVEVRMIDSNGESVGSLVLPDGQPSLGYVLRLPDA